METRIKIYICPERNVLNRWNKVDMHSECQLKNAVRIKFLKPHTDVFWVNENKPNFPG